MKKEFLMFTLLVAITTATNAQSQSWNYDFGETEASFNPNPGSYSTSFLPKPGLNATKSIKQGVRIRTGSDGAGEFNLVKAGADFIKGVGLEIVPAAANSKFSIFNIEGTMLSYTSFQIKFDSSNGLQWIFANGNTIGREDAFQGNSNIKETDTEVFAGLRWMLNDNNGIKFSNRVNTKWVTINEVTFSKNNSYTIEVYSNNSAVEQTYKKDGNYTLKPNTYEVWANGKKVLTANGGSVAETPINAFFILGQKLKDVETKPKAWVDNIAYADHL